MNGQETVAIFILLYVTVGVFCYKEIPPRVPGPEKWKSVDLSDPKAASP